MARIAVATSHPPFARGGHLVIAHALVTALEEAGHEAALLLTPQNRFGRQIAAYTATWLTDVGVAHDGRPVDQVISLRFPSYALRHRTHVCWLNHRMREYYDQWPAFAGSLSPRARVKERVRRGLIHAVDTYLLTRNVTAVVAQSETIRDRLERWGGIPSRVVHPPAPSRPYRCDGYGDVVLVGSRLTPLKRVGLAIDALAEPDARAVRLVVVGDGAEAAALQGLARTRGVADRVTFVGDVDDDELVTWLARCRAVCFPARSEDYGLVTVEAFASAKAVVTCTDSGGPVELVRDGTNGLVVPPHPTTLANALRSLCEDRGLAERLGGAALTDAAGLTWERTLEQLVLV